MTALTARISANFAFRARRQNPQPYACVCPCRTTDFHSKVQLQFLNVEQQIALRTLYAGLFQLRTCLRDHSRQ